MNFRHIAADNEVLSPCLFVLRKDGHKHKKTASCLWSRTLPADCPATRVKLRAKDQLSEAERERI